MRDLAIVKTKELRVQLDNALQQFSHYTDPINLRNSEAMPQARLRLKESIMWLGMILKELDVPTPYPNSYNSRNLTIDPTADGIKL